MKTAVDKADDIATVDLARATTLDDIRRADEVLINHPDRASIVDAIYDCTGADFSSFSSENLIGHAQRLSDKIDQLPGRIALVADRDREFGICRMWEIHAESIAPRTRRVFRTLEDAQTGCWLYARRPELSARRTTHSS